MHGANRCERETRGRGWGAREDRGSEAKIEKIGTPRHEASSMSVVNVDQSARTGTT